MGSGPGRAQRAILAALDDGQRIGAVELAHALGMSVRQMERAIHALEDRGLVQLSRGLRRKLYVQRAGPATQKVRVNVRTIQIPARPVQLKVKSLGPLGKQAIAPPPPPKRRRPAPHVVDPDT